MKKQNLLPAIVLTTICLVTAALLAAVNLLTAPVVEKNEKEALRKSLAEALPAASAFDELSAGGLSTEHTEIVSVYKDTAGAGFVVIATTKKGYTGKPITLSVGVDSDGKVVNVIVTNSSETKNTAAIDAYPSAFTGKGADEADRVELVSGVTYTSRAYRTAISDALAAVAKAGKGEGK